MMNQKKLRRALILSGGGARGAYQAGVWKFLLEMNWKPDLICGTSVGAINATAIACNLELPDLIQLWKNIERGNVYRISIIRQIIHFLLRRGFKPLMDTEPLKKLLLEKINFQELRKSKYSVIIAAVNILTSQLRFFDQNEIDIEHVMASSAIPFIFPWHYIDGEPYWDGAPMANTPILPALQRGVEEIIVILLSPVGGSRLDLPKTKKQVIERMFEQTLIGSYESFMAHLSWEEKIRSRQSTLKNIIRRTLSLGDVRIATVAPNRMLGFHSIVNFSEKQADLLISEGYIDGKNQLAHFFGLEELI